MNVKLNNEVGARFKLIARNKDGGIARETDWFLNKVLTSGLARMSTGVWIDRCCVGSGNSIPISSQTSLDAFVASTTVVQDTEGITQTIIPMFWGARRTWRFAEGVATGNLSEVGMGWADNQLWNRALVRDSAGNPTTITVLFDEILDVVCEVRVYPQESFSGSFPVLDKTGALLSTINFTGIPSITSGGSWNANKVELKAGGGSDNLARLYSGVISSTTTEPNTAIGYIGKSSATLTYPTPTSIKYDAAIALNQLNDTHQSIRIGATIMGGGATIAPGSIQMQFDPPFIKTASLALRYILEMSWSEYTGVI